MKKKPATEDWLLFFDNPPKKSGLYYVYDTNTKTIGMMFLHVNNNPDTAKDWTHYKKPTKKFIYINPPQ